MRIKRMGWIWLLVLLAACTSPGGQTEAGVWDQSRWDQANWQ
ncbi:MAG: hypothetical protein KatS3mg075_460 [Meiothermus sp.]|jgi:hypothetical protein|nr:MAG: hypothetical protein KatS3mg075_460 [Meiothermus sp.]